MHVSSIQNTDISIHQSLKSFLGFESNSAVGSLSECQLILLELEKPDAGIQIRKHHKREHGYGIYLYLCFLQPVTYSNACSSLLQYVIMHTGFGIVFSFKFPHMTLFKSEQSSLGN